MDPLLSAARTATYDFFFGELDTLIRVEECEGEVLVRCTRATFSLRRREYFVRELAAEGFIPDRFRWLLLAEDVGSCGVRWITDCSWVELPEVVLARSRRFMIRLLTGSAVLWASALVVCVCYRP